MEVILKRSFPSSLISSTWWKFNLRISRQKSNKKGFSNCSKECLNKASEDINNRFKDLITKCRKETSEQDKIYTNSINKWWAWWEKLLKDIKTKSCNWLENLFLNRKISIRYNNRELKNKTSRFWNKKWLINWNEKRLINWNEIKK